MAGVSFNLGHRSEYLFVLSHAVDTGRGEKSGSGLMRIH